MSDFISRQAVLEMLHSLGGCDASDAEAKGWDKAIDAAIGELDKITVAFDVDKVVAQLESFKCSKEEAEKDMDKFIRNQHFDMCISIVKAGGWNKEKEAIE